MDGNVITFLIELRQVDRLHALCGHLKFRHIGVVGNDIQPKWFRPSRHRGGNVSKRNQTERLPPEPGYLFKDGPALIPIAAIDHLIHQLASPSAGK